MGFIPKQESVYAEEPEERAFYALSSLCFYLERKVEESDQENKILFSEEDVQNLWEAAAHSTFFNQIDLAQKHYYEALEKKEGELSSKQLFAKAKEILNNLWEKQNKALIAQEGDSHFSHETKHLNGHFLYEEGGAFKGDLFSLKHPFNINKDKEHSRFLLSSHHWLNDVLENIFGKSNVLKNAHHFEGAGFNILHKRPSTLIIASHPFISGHLVKIFLNDTNKTYEQMWNNFINRCLGAENIRNLIKKKKLRFFTVPDKWIFVTPDEEKIPVLVVTKMNLVENSVTRKAWKQVTKEQLQELYCIISHGYASTRLILNIPLTKEGVFACIDTEQPQRIPLYDHARVYFSHDMQKYWDKLVRTGGKP